MRSKPPTQIFPLPALTLHALSDLVVMRDANADADELVAEVFQALMIQPHDLSGLLFANFFAHEKDEYVEVARK
jgi:hypothetical protein